MMTTVLISAITRHHIAIFSDLFENVSVKTKNPLQPPRLQKRRSPLNCTCRFQWCPKTTATWLLLPPHLKLEEGEGEEVSGGTHLKTASGRLAHRSNTSIFNAEMNLCHTSHATRHTSHACRRELMSSRALFYPQAKGDV
jgi:hypothetical protein